MPLPRSLTGQSTLSHDGDEFIIPLGYDHLLTAVGLDVEGFIEEWKASNPTQHQLLEEEVVHEAVEHFVMKVIPGGNRDMVDNFWAQVR